MHTQLDLKALERNAWRSMHRDGVMDIAFSLFLFAGWARGVTGEPAAGIALTFAAPVLMWLGKRFITVPRMGLVRFSSERRRRRRLLLVMLGAAVTVTTLLYLTATTAVSREGVPPNIVSATIPILIFATFASMAYLMDVTRLYYVALVFTGTELMKRRVDSPLVFLVGGVLVLVPGLVLLIGFLRAYPIGENSDAHAA